MGVVTQEVAEIGLTQEELSSIQEINTRLGRLTEEATYRFTVEDWIAASDEMVELFNSFPMWDQTFLNSMEVVFDQACEKVRRQQGDEAVDRFVNNWHGWFAEASVRRVFDDLGIELQVSEKIDKKGVDGFAVFASLEQSFYVFIQTKSSQSVPPGIHLINPQNTDYEADIEAPGRNRKVRNLINSRTSYNRLKLDPARDLKRKPAKDEGDIYTFCQRTAAEIRQDFLNKHKGKINPETHESKMLLLLVGVGMEPQEANPKYG